MTYEYVDASQVFDDNNNGLVYGVNYIDDSNEIADCEWFATEAERENAVKDMVGVK